MTQEPIKFDRERASKYDLDIRKAIPGYEALHEMAYTLLEKNSSQQSHVLVTGSGTGMEIINLCQRNPHWKFIGVEPSTDMMEIAKNRIEIQGFTQQVKWHPDYVDSLPETQVMDAATLLLIMHFIPDDGSKLSLLQNIAKRLKSGATLVLADLHGDRESNSFKQLLLVWKSFYFNRLENISIEDKNKFDKAVNSIYLIPENRIASLLKEVGFIEITRFYNAFLFGGWSAKLR
ncbi:MAG: class I SAM-dependent methyltransferase [Xenococcaceae cyanobacterium]